MGVQVIPPSPAIANSGAPAVAVTTLLLPSAAVSATAAANTAVVITIAAVAGQSVRLNALSYELSVFVAATAVTVVSNGVTIWQASDLGAGLVTVPLPDGGLQGATGFSMVITLAAGGAGSVGIVNAGYFQR